ncbi:hypothetical protein [Streptomyces capillispiralis]|uniref:hypothetical protein n=1 Tax=Streptomyces capillispiralis TaxID=68182 RepID=UPI00167B7F43|nr:hypothetical protein [Streptomyces capillispiralis]
MTTLLLLGAAGGALRGLLDVYIRFLDWQADRRAHRRSPADQEGQPPRFADHFDPVGDSVAAVVHSAMGAGAAVLFGTTGQISGAYAALVVGISAPVILTQLGRVQSVSDALTGPPATEAAPGAGAPATETGAGTGPFPAAPPAPPAPPELAAPPGPAATAGTGVPDGSRAPVRSVTSVPQPPYPPSRGMPEDGADGPDPAAGGAGRTPLSRGPALGEEGST